MRFAAPFLTLSALGFLGILSLVPTLGRVVEQVRRMPGAPAIPDTALLALMLLQPTLLLFAAVAMGVRLADRTDLVCLILRRYRGQAWPAAAGRWPSTLALAALAGTVTTALDLILRNLFPGSFTGIPRLDEVSLAGRLAGLLYGGLTEELLMRFGLMTLLLWLGIRLVAGRKPFLVWTAVVLAALVFAAGHLPALMGTAQPDRILILRTLGLNAGLGVLFGWLYASRALEHAMLAHGAAHVVFWIATPFPAALGF